MELARTPRRAVNSPEACISRGVMTAWSPAKTNRSLPGRIRTLALSFLLFKFRHPPSPPPRSCQQLDLSLTEMSSNEGPYTVHPSRPLSFISECTSRNRVRLAEFTHQTFPECEHTLLEHIINNYHKLHLPVIVFDFWFLSWVSGHATKMTKKGMRLFVLGELFQLLKKIAE